MRQSHRSLPMLLVALAAAGPAVAQNSDDEAARIQRVEQGLTTPVRVRGTLPVRFGLGTRMAHYRVPGVSIAVVDGQRLAWARGYGVADTVDARSVTPATLFQAASISKPLTAAAVLRLVERGVLDLDAPANRYLRRWKIPDAPVASGDAVTLRHLLTHTAGLTVHGFPGYPHGWVLPHAIAILQGLPEVNTRAVRLDTIPGSIWRYSGGGYTVLQVLLEDVMGASFPQLMRDLVLDPAGMLASTYEQPLPPERAWHAARGHDREGRRVESGWHDYPEMAAAGLWTTPSELALLVLDLQAALRGEEGRLLSPAMAAVMMSDGPGGFGLGFKVDGHGEERTFSHGGSNNGFKAQLIAFTEDGQAAVVMTNGDNGGALAQELVLSIAHEYGWPGIAQEVREPGKGLGTP
ncbi:MAG TPA: serine hydrolase domain-containing protein [Longimicrobiales bacterium]|nr:serine hydrolase domain-containing protein [Longimicrobiales bacterium]